MAEKTLKEKEKSLLDDLETVRDSLSAANAALRDLSDGILERFLTLNRGWDYVPQDEQDEKNRLKAKADEAIDEVKKTESGWKGVSQAEYEELVPRGIEYYEADNFGPRITRLEGLAAHRGKWLSKLDERITNLEQKLDIDRQTMADVMGHLDRLEKRMEKLETGWEIASIDHDPRQIMRDGTALAEIRGLLQGISEQLKRMEG